MPPDRKRARQRPAGLAPGSRQDKQQAAEQQDINGVVRLAFRRLLHLLQLLALHLLRRQHRCLRFCRCQRFAGRQGHLQAEAPALFRNKLPQLPVHRETYVWRMGDAQAANKSSYSLVPLRSLLLFRSIEPVAGQFAVHHAAVQLLVGWAGFEDWWRRVQWLGRYRAAVPDLSKWGET